MCAFDNQSEIATIHHDDPPIPLSPTQALSLNESSFKERLLKVRASFSHPFLSSLPLARLPCLQFVFLMFFARNYLQKLFVGYQN